MPVRVHWSHIQCRHPESRTNIRLLTSSTERNPPVLSQVLVLEHDTELAEAVAPERRAGAIAASRAQVAEVPVRRLDETVVRRVAKGGHGLLVLDGVLSRRVSYGGRHAAELLGPGDIWRPWQHDEEEVSVPFVFSWHAMTALRVAILGPRWTLAMAPYPEVGAALTGRAVGRARHLAILMAIAQQPRLDERLKLLFAELGDRFGRVDKRGVRIDVPLTHDMLSELAAARRPSVSAALSRLSSQGVLEREGRSWRVLAFPDAESAA